MRRRYDVKGTNLYMFWAVGLLLVGLLFLWDGWLVGWFDGFWEGWLPRRAVLERHPSPEDSFYLFNQVTSVIFLSAAAVCGYIHHVVK